MFTFGPIELLILLVIGGLFVVGPVVAAVWAIRLMRRDDPPNRNEHAAASIAEVPDARGPHGRD